MGWFNVKPLCHVKLYYNIIYVASLLFVLLINLITRTLWATSLIISKVHLSTNFNSDNGRTSVIAAECSTSSLTAVPLR